MNMSDDVSSATLQVSMTAAEKAIDTASHTIDQVIDQIAKLLQAISVKKAGKSSVKATDLTELHPGEVSIRDLIADARRSKDSISTSEHGLTAEDQKYISKKAKEYGIPIAFTGDKHQDNIYANVRTNDVEIFRQICTDMMKTKLEQRPQELGNFKVQEWEIPFITAELKRHDLSAQFGKTNGGESFALYEKADEKAILIARGEFVRKCNELQNQMHVDKDENGFFTIKDFHSGRELSFDQVMTHTELSRQLQQQFNYDTNKANIACAKFGEENLDGEEKQQFFSTNPQNNFSKIDSNITVEGESIYAKPYDCWRITPKSDSIPRIVLRDASTGNFAVLNPEKMTHAQMRSTLSSSLHISDNQTLKALVEKAEKVSDFYIKQDSNYFTHTYALRKSDFDLTDPQVVSGMLRTDAHGNRLAKALPVTEVSNSIKRIDRNAFTVTSSTQSIETDQDGVTHPVTEQQQRKLSFSDKKNAITELKDMYKQQGIPEHVATQLAKDVFAKAKAQSAEKVLQIQELKLDSPHYIQIVPTIKVACGTDTASIDMTDDAAAKDTIMKNFHVSESAATCTLNQAREMITEREEAVLGKYGFQDLDHWTMDEAHEMISAIEKNHWALPKGISPEKYVPERLRDESSNIGICEKLNASASGISTDSKLPDIPKIEVPTTGRGGR